LDFDFLTVATVKDMPSVESPAILNVLVGCSAREKRSRCETVPEVGESALVAHHIRW
jgi:hypothetical protein